MHKKVFFKIFLFIHIWLFAACANIVAPTGGPKDVSPPVIKRRSVQDSTLNFKGGKFVFEFDEFIQLKDADKEVIITPLLKSKPKISVNKKSLTIAIPDSLLLPNTTYNISLGSAVQDLRESNVFKGFHFTFSTGSYFDSLSLKGAVFDAETGQPDTSSLVMLYLAKAGDSAIFQTKPLYVQKPNQGHFEFKNLPNKDFLIYALQDKNNNLKYDSAQAEKIAFYQNRVQPSDAQLFLELYSFLEKNKKDTTAINPFKKSSNSNKGNIPFSYTVNIDTTQAAKRTFDINDSIWIVFTDSIAHFDDTKIRLFQDENYDATSIIKLDSGLQKAFIKVEWQQDAFYSLQLQKNFAQNKSNVQAKADTFRFRTKKESDYGYLQLSVNMNKKHLYLLYKDNKLTRSQIANDTLISFPLLTPGDYQLCVLQDENENGKWDTGNLILAKQPELVRRFQEQIKIKANWGNKLNLQNFNEKKKTSLSHLK